MLGVVVAALRRSAQQLEVAELMVRRTAHNANGTVKHCINPFIESFYYCLDFSDSNSKPLITINNFWVKCNSRSILALFST
jgi:hypothetical protein